MEDAQDNLDGQCQAVAGVEARSQNLKEVEVEVEVELVDISWSLVVGASLHAALVVDFG